MTKRKTDIEQPAAAAQETEPAEAPAAVVQDAKPVEAPVEQDVLQRIAREWISNLVEKTPTVAADRIAAGLHAAGIHTQEDLAHANVNLVRRVLVAALQADAHSLTGTAARFRLED